MHSSHSLYACLFLFSFCGFFSALEAGSVSWAPTSFRRVKLRATIDAVSKWSYGRPLTFYTPLDETCQVNRTQCSIKVTILDKVTVATMTGGVLGNKVFQFYSYLFSWIACGCTGAYDFKAYVVFFDSCYGSYEEAMKHPEGIAVVTVPITTSGNYSNPKFDAYGKFFECQLKDDVHVANIKSAYTYTWFVNFPHGGIYHVCTQPYTDEDSGKQTTAVFITLPSDPAVNFISNDQFQTFLKMGNSMGQNFGSGSCSKVETYKGITVYNLPA